MSDPDEQLRTRLQALDPMHPAAVPEPLAPHRARQILEAAMTDNRQSPTRARPWLLVAAAAAVLVVGGGIAVATIGTDGDDPADGVATTLELAFPASDVEASCIAFDVAFLADMPTAFAGTATSVTDEAVTFDVERWYAGGEADIVTAEKVDPNTSAALDGVQFAAGERYLVTASETGTLNGCGFSGAATPELEAAFAEAFPG